MTDFRPKVAFDVTPIISGRTGIARYVTALGAALEAKRIELRRFAVGRSPFPVPPDTRRLRVPARVVDRCWGTVSWPRVEQFVGQVDLVHATGLLTPATRRPLVVTVHDVAAVRHPNLHPARHVRQQQAQIDALDRASAIVTVSRATADDLVYLGISPDRLVVAPLGAVPLPAPAPKPDDAGRPQRYLLTVGETSPRKGYGVILRSLARLEPDIGLVMAGPPAGDEQRLQSLTSELGLSARVERVGAVNDAALAGFYRGALGLCFPSVAEGFGLPVLEAMAAGLPVLANDIPAIRELAGDAALYVAPGADALAWADAISSLVSDPQLRARLASAGRKRAAQFSWERTATATLDAYRLALEALR